MQVEHDTAQDLKPAPQPRQSRRPGVSADHAHYKWWALSCTSLGMLLATVNSGTLIIALPDLGRSLHTSVLQLVWVILAYMISSTVLVLTAGRLSDLFGRKRAYLGGFVVFALRKSGIPASDPRLQKGVAWLKSHQRASGRWFHPTLSDRPNHVLSNTATAWAVMALEACDEIKGGP